MCVAYASYVPICCQFHPAIPCRTVLHRHGKVPWPALVPPLPDDGSGVRQQRPAAFTALRGVPAVLPPYSASENADVCIIPPASPDAGCLCAGPCRLQQPVGTSHAFSPWWSRSRRRYPCRPLRAGTPARGRRARGRGIPDPRGADAHCRQLLCRPAAADGICVQIPEARGAAHAAAR